MSEQSVDDLAWYLAQPYETTVEVADCDGRPCYLARNPELRGCMSHGATPEEAVKNLSEARELYLRTLLENGVRPPLPAPSAATRVR
jgi:predicted RNase H-like HicB family nuclease